MKKMIVFAGMAVMAVVAQAVTIDWNDTGWTPAKSGSFDLDGSGKGYWSTNSSAFYSGGADIALRVTYAGNTRSEGQAWSNLLYVGWDGGNVSIQMETTDGEIAIGPYNANTGYTAYWYRETTDESTAVTIPVDKTDVKMIFAVVYDDAASTLDIYSSTDGSTYTHLTSRENIDINGQLTIGDAIGTGGSHPGGVFEGQTTYTLEYLVPEPTCLALLALGVAGFALKRKVA